MFVDSTSVGVCGRESSLPVNSGACTIVLQHYHMVVGGGFIGRVNTPL